MVVGAGGHLGQMRHSQHLAVFAKLFHEATHGFGDCAANTRIHFVKNECLCGA